MAFFLGPFFSFLRETKFFLFSLFYCFLKISIYSMVITAKPHWQRLGDWVSLINQQNLCLGKNTSFIPHEPLTWLQNIWNCCCFTCAVEIFIMMDKIMLAVLSSANVANCIVSLFLLLVGCFLFLGIKKKSSHLLIWCYLPYIPIITTFALTLTKMGLGMGMSVGKFLLCYD